MNVLIAIPTLNESENISAITQKIDEIIGNLKGIRNAVILNVDCSSTDSTALNFKSCNTVLEKKTLTVPVGKGNAMFAAIQECFEGIFDYLIFTDADIDELPAEMFESFLTKLVAGADLVVPWRKPIWNALDLTNQLCLPVVRAYFDTSIHETIGGEIGLSSKACKALTECPWPDSAFDFGVDIHISLTCMKDLSVAEIPFQFSKGNKLRSYHHDGPVVTYGSKFISVLNSLCSFIANHDLTLSDTMRLHAVKIPWELPPIPYDDELNSIAELNRDYFSSADLSGLNSLGLDDSEVQRISKCLIDGKGLFPEDWVQILISYIEMSKNYNLNDELQSMMQQLFIARTVNHYKENIGNSKWYESIEAQANYAPTVLLQG